MATAGERPVNEVEGMVAIRDVARPILVEISPGELIDKITILEIKQDRILDPKKLRNVTVELELLKAARRQMLFDSDNLEMLTRELKAINESLWKTEDKIRDCERRQDFGEGFICLARSVYRTNDLLRAAVKREINELLDSGLAEEKLYTNYELPKAAAP